MTRALLVAVALLAACSVPRAADHPPPAAVSSAPAPPPPAGCRGEGQDVEGKGPERCCPGLRPLSQAAPTPTGCVSDAPPSVLVCAACGDGTCGRGENRCNCPEDCK